MVGNKNKFMIILSIITVSGLSIFAFLKLMQVLSIKSRKKEFKDWELDDTVYLNKSGETDKYVLRGWSTEAIYVLIHESNSVLKVEWSDFKFNKSAIWRRNYDSCKSDMNGKAPNFYRGLKETPSVNMDKTINGKQICLLTEIECQIYLKQCLDEEDYETAELIKKQMEKFR